MPGRGRPLLLLASVACGGHLSNETIEVPRAIVCFADGTDAALANSEGQLLLLDRRPLEGAGAAPACPFTSSSGALFARGMSVSAPYAPAASSNGWNVDRSFLYHVQIEYVSPRYELWVLRGPRRTSAPTRWVRLNEHVDDAERLGGDRSVLPTERWVFVGLDWFYAIPRDGSPPKRFALPARMDSMAAADDDTIFWVSWAAPAGGSTGLYRTTISSGMTTRIADGPATRIRMLDDQIWFLRDQRSVMRMTSTGATEIAAVAAPGIIRDYLPRHGVLYWATEDKLMVSSQP